MAFSLLEEDRRKREFVNLRMDQELFQRIKRKAEERQLNLSDTIRGALKEGLK